jgi:hypothetical protein
MKIGFDQTKSIADIGILISDGPIYKNIFSFETTLPIGIGKILLTSKCLFPSPFSFAL